MVILDSPELQDSPVGTDLACLVMTPVFQDSRDFLDLVLMDRQDSLDMDLPDFLDILLKDFRDHQDFPDTLLMDFPDHQDFLDTLLGRQATLPKDSPEVLDRLDIRLMDTERQFRPRRSPSTINENILCA